MAPQDSILSDLMLDASYADTNERMHQRKCPARGAALDCQSCQWHAAEVLRTDIRLRDYFAALKDEVA